MSARISDATRHRAAVNVITPVNVPVIDPTIGQVNFPRRISVADARPPPRSAQRRSAIVCRRSRARRRPIGTAPSALRTAWSIRATRAPASGGVFVLGLLPRCRDPHCACGAFPVADNAGDRPHLQRRRPLTGKPSNRCSGSGNPRSSLRAYGNGDAQAVRLPRRIPARAFTRHRDAGR
jgi:hypothetical protein